VKPSIDQYVLPSPPRMDNAAAEAGLARPEIPRVPTRRTRPLRLLPGPATVTTAERLRALLQAYGADFVAAGLAIAAAGTVHAWGMGVSPARFDDEGTYVAQAWAIVEQQSLAHYTYWYDHPPLAWMLLALWSWVVGGFEHSSSLVPARGLMLGIHLLTCMLLYILARRIGLRRVLAAATVALFSLSPLALHYHRQVLLDNFAVFWLVAAFVLALSPSRRLWAYGGSGICLAAAALCKETALLLTPALIVAVWMHMPRASRRFCATIFGTLFILTASSYLLLATLKGELLPGSGHVSIVDSVRIQLLDRESTGSVFDEESGSHMFVSAWLDLDPWLVLAALALLPVALATRRIRWAGVAYLIQVLMIFRPGYLPAMYVIALLPFAAIIVGATADAVWGWRPTRARLLGPAVAGALLVAASATVAPAWARADWRQMTVDADKPYRQAVSWMAKHVDRDSAVLVDDSFWVDLVERGFDEKTGVVWYNKLDHDPEVSARFARGWRDFDYVVSTEYMRATLHIAPSTRKALADTNSTVVARFGDDEYLRVEIRRIQPRPALQSSRLEARRG
jgi:hypothetical protein